MCPFDVRRRRAFSTIVPRILRLCKNDQGRISRLVFRFYSIIVISKYCYYVLSAYRTLFVLRAYIHFFLNIQRKLLNFSTSGRRSVGFLWVRTTPRRRCWEPSVDGVVRKGIDGPVEVSGVESRRKSKRNRNNPRPSVYILFDFLFSFLSPPVGSWGIHVEMSWHYIKKKTISKRNAGGHLKRP